MNKKLMNEIFSSITKTKKLLESFPPDDVKDITTTAPSNLMAEIILRDLLNKEKIDA
jgi:hypothetical protein